MCSEMIFIRPYQIDAIRIPVKTIICHLILYPECGQGKACQTYCQTDNTDYTLCFMFQYIPKDYFKIMLYHGFCIFFILLSLTRI